MIYNDTITIYGCITNSNVGFVFHQKQPTVIKQSSVVNYLMRSVTSTWLQITVRFILGYVVRRLVIT